MDPQKHWPRGKRGFTLIEITLALGIVSFAFIGLLGLLPAGLQTFRSAVDTSVRSQIIQRICSDAMQADFDTLISNPPADRYFDDQGNEIAQQRSMYQVRVQIGSSTDLPSSLETNANLATVQILIANNPAHVADPYSNSASVFQTTVFVARNEHR
ncbi:MAG: Verru_Chthon cassette protein B [Chthoniobacteraceae bacterium]